MNAHNLPALPEKIDLIISQYEAKRAAIPESISQMQASIDAAKGNCCMGSAFVSDPIGYVPLPSEKAMAETLTESAWQHVYRLAKVDMLAPASERADFEKSLEQHPEFTAENVMATFGPYLADPRHYILKGLAECFSKLDPAYKSHSKVKIGVKGLPKKIIIQRCGDGVFNGYGLDTLRDALNALRMVSGQPHLSRFQFEDIYRWNRIEAGNFPEWEPGKVWRSGDQVHHEGQTYRAMDYIRPADAFERGEKEYRGWRLQEHVMPGIEVRRFQNGNAHLIFSKDWLRKINLALAEFYGDVLPETEEEASQTKRASTEVSKDLAFYWTPEKVTRKILRETRMNKDNYSYDYQQKLGNSPAVLEPSCGEGHMMDIIAQICPSACLSGVECHAGRAAIAASKGHRVQVGNFLEFTAKPVWDLVVMNPPFANGHWKKHLMHALKFLRNGKTWNEQGELVCILPASAEVDGHLKELGIKYTWRDLPMASFKDAGTNVATGFIQCGPQ
ncbi:N6 adenine-specific DNA methyltransferase, N12 class [Roseobacter sp. SK209-2-6]|uniref:DUF4942 domain-containing protein n=1 Tax=Roseobacter sp. SK209-2-6 TaxID=388739 RepID=UPI0000F3C678|nr:DUF4942 domain-containing protein [Roseobacter sp. SK209-2-6]EBA18415.1 N6 adenine-specific DNA methyltransferase, N12 class [Roseobacter sp. SK209-2-6]